MPTLDQTQQQRSVWPAPGSTACSRACVMHEGSVKNHTTITHQAHWHRRQPAARPRPPDAVLRSPRAICT